MTEQEIAEIVQERDALRTKVAVQQKYIEWSDKQQVETLEQLEIERNVVRCDAKMYMRLYEASTRALEAAKERIAVLELSHQERLEDYFRGNLRLYDQESLRNFQFEVGAWGQETFPNSTIGTIQLHLLEEAEELRYQLDRWKVMQEPVKDSVVWPTVLGEFADCFLLMCHLAHRRDFDLLDVLRDKFNSVKCRKWEWDAERGYYKHVYETEKFENHGSQEGEEA